MPSYLRVQDLRRLSRRVGGELCLPLTTFAPHHVCPAPCHEPSEVLSKHMTRKHTYMQASPIVSRISSIPQKRASTATRFIHCLYTCTPNVWSSEPLLQPSPAVYLLFAYTHLKRSLTRPLLAAPNNLTIGSPNSSFRFASEFHLRPSTATHYPKRRVPPPASVPTPLLSSHISC